MQLYKRLLINNFKASFTFRVNFLIGLAFNFLYIFLQVFIWKGLYGGSGEAKMGIYLNEIIAYTVFSKLTQQLTRLGVMREINDSVQDGRIALRLLLPVGFRSYYFTWSLSSNLLWSLYTALPPILTAALVFGLRFDFSLANLGFYILSAALALLINFCFEFIMGMSVIWFKNSFFLDNFTELIFKLFSGAIVPMWFFPDSLNAVSYVLPFRYIIFEPVSILLGKTPPERIPVVLAIQAAWAAGLFLLMSLVWGKGRRYIMVQGG